MHELCITTHSGSSPLLGNAQIKQTVIDDTAYFLVQSLSSHYLTLVSEIFVNLQNDSGYYDRNESGFAFMNIPNRSEKFRNAEIRISQRIIKEMQGQSVEEVTNNGRYFSRFLYDTITGLDKENPLENLLILLSEKVSSVGFRCKKAEVRFEKGCLGSMAYHWHLDQAPFSPFQTDHFITISYSTIDNWSTRIVLQEDPEAVFKALMNLENESETVEKLERLSKSSELGHFYNVTQILHRSPEESELSRSVAPYDYRIFVRLSTEPYPRV